MVINATWHKKHVMPSLPTPAQRLRWHEAHAKHCGCRPFTASMRAKLRHEVAVTKRPSRSKV
jgi:hypothetical protein